MYRLCSSLVACAAMVLVACVSEKPVQCKISADCNLHAGGSCDLYASSGNMWCTYPDDDCPNGRRWSDFNTGDGLSGQCQDEQMVADAGVDASMPVDAGVDAGVDASPDAMMPPGTDAGPEDPIVANGQAAELVLGQQNFTSRAINDSGVTAKSLGSAVGVASDGSSLWVLDSGNARAVRWSPLPSASYADANMVLGKNNFTDGSAPVGTSGSNLAKTCCSGYVAISGTKLVIADSLRHRVLVWNPLPTTNGQSANLALGQTALTGATSGTAANKFDTPAGVWTDGTRLAVADAANNRVLIWNTFPTQNGQAADLVLGQIGFDTKTDPSPPTASSMAGPRDVYFDGTRFYVADRRNHRVLVWNGFPTSNGQAADYVIGQSSLTADTAGTFQNPRGLAVAGDALFVVDYSRHRVLVFTPIPTTSGEQPAHVLGQPDFTLPAESSPEAPTQSNMGWPETVEVVGNKLYVGDQWNNRVLRYHLNLQ